MKVVWLEVKKRMQERENKNHSFTDVTWEFSFGSYRTQENVVSFRDVRNVQETGIERGDSPSTATFANGICDGISSWWRVSPRYYAGHFLIQRIEHICVCFQSCHNTTRHHVTFH